MSMDGDWQNARLVAILALITTMRGCELKQLRWRDIDRGSSLLYSEEFYGLLKRHLRPGGILQQWMPDGGEPIVQSAIAKALRHSFFTVRVFTSVMDYGFHFLASMSPIPPATPEILVSRMPESAASDMIEWGPETDPERQFAAALRREVSLDELIQKYPAAPAMVDDRPVNEYYFLRHRPALFQRLVAQVLPN